MSLADLQNLKGKPAVYRPQRDNSRLAFFVTIEDVRRSYGRNEAKIVPAHGDGDGWVKVDNLTLRK